MGESYDLTPTRPAGGPADEYHDGDLATVIDARLVGGPADLPAELRSQRVITDQVKVKVCHYGGYEHFEREVPHLTDGPPVFRWTGRTRIAE